MNKIIKLIAISLALTMLLLPVLGEMNSGNSGGSSTDSSQSSSESAGSGMSDTKSVDSGSNSADSTQSVSSSKNEKASEMYDSGSKMRKDSGMTGMGFMQREDNNYGNYVTFSVDKTSGDVINFGIKGTSLFDSVKISGFDFKDSKTHLTPYFLPKSNVAFQSKGFSEWYDMLYSLWDDPQKWLEQYHMRSISETVNSMKRLATSRF